MFYEIAEKYTMAATASSGPTSSPGPASPSSSVSSFTPFTLYPPVTDRVAWEALDEEWKKEAVALGERYLHFEFPPLTAMDFLDFTRSGNRVRYEDKCFSKRHALNALVLAECVEDKGRFLDDIVNGIFSICEESAWQLPPHNSYIRDTPQLPLPDSTAPVLDLFACESGAVLATVCYLLKSRLDEISPFITKRIRHELNQRIFTPYLDSHFWWMGNGEEPMNNWTIWCTQNVLLSVFLLNQDISVDKSATSSSAYETSDAFRAAVLRKASRSIDYFLVEYGEDGCCDEGAQYYRHAGLCLFNAMEILNAVTGGAFSELYLEPKIRNIASYIFHVHIDDKYYVNFADCSPVAGRAGVREFLFALRTKNQDMAAFAAADFLAGMPETLLLPRENNLYYRLQNAFTVREIRAYAMAAAADAASTERSSRLANEASTNMTSKLPLRHPDIYYPSVGIFIARDNVFCLAVKAGNNGDSHNHNDTGSFTVYRNGLPLFIDVGVESYTKKTFSPQRYEIWTMQSAYHNLPTVNSHMQKDGESYGASDVSYQLTDTVCQIDMELSGAYPAESGLRSYHRCARLVKGQDIVIEDRFVFNDNAPGNMDNINSADNAEKQNCEKCASQPNTVVMSLMTYEKPVVIAKDASLVLCIGSDGLLSVTGGRLSHIETIPITDARLQTAWEHEVYRILIDVDETDNCKEELPMETTGTTACAAENTTGNTSAYIRLRISSSL